jgi:FSR family fosmidomycin resistance protein-like MFS transporter
MPVLATLTICHLLNDTLQSLLPALYPMIKSGFRLDYWQIGLITFTNSVTASVLQPIVGLHTDRTPRPYSLVAGMGFMLSGLLCLAFAHRYGVILAGAGLIGVGSSIFHPESSRLARLASGGRHGFAQSLFQTGGNLGSSLGPLLAAFVVLPRGQSSVAWFSILAVVALVLLWRLGTWHRDLRAASPAPAAAAPRPVHAPARARIVRVLLVLLALVFSKYVYLASLTSYFMFFLIDRFGISEGRAQLHLFAFLAAVAAGTFAGGPIGDRVGRRHVISWSIFGVLPFALALPYASLFWTGVLSVVIGLVLASAFSAILVYAQELVPGRVGLVAGLFFGFAFGIAGLGAMALGHLADLTGIQTVFRICAVLPALGVLALWLPDPARR